MRLSSPHISLAVGSALLALLVAGCGAPKPLTEKQAAQVVFTKANAGPTFVKGDDSALTTRLGCLETMASFSGKAATKPASSAISQFGIDSRSGLPAVRTEVRSYDDQATAAAVMKAIKAQATKCTEVKIDGETSHFQMTVQHDEKKSLKDANAQLNTIGLGEVSSTKGMKLPTGLWLTHAIKDNNLLAITYLNYSVTDEDVALAYNKAAWQRLTDVMNGNKPPKGAVELPKQPAGQETQGQ